MFANYYDLNMNPINTEGLLTLDLEVPSIPFDNIWGGGSDGILPHQIGVEVQQRTINAHIELVSRDYLDYNLLKDYVYGVFGYNTPFYIVDKRTPYKRYRVILEAGFSPERHGSNNGSAVVPFITERLPYAESIGTTQDIEQNGVSANDELWGFGMGLIADEESLKYTHTGTEFSIYNAGSVPIHPYEQELLITCDNIQGSSTYFEIRNLTTRDIFRANEPVNNHTIIKLDGPNVTSNGLQYYRKTNKRFITLKPGWNNFVVNGASSARISFDFPFYYK